MALFKGDVLIAGTNPSGGGAGGGHVIQDSTGEEFEQRPALQFIGADVVDNETDEATQVITPSFREIQGDIPDINLVCLDGIPIGGIIPYGAPIDTLSQDWLPCLGQAISRTLYHELFAKYGTIYGSGDGSTTFNLPNYGGRVPVGLDENDTDFDILGETLGEKAHSLIESELPEISASFQIHGQEGGTEFYNLYGKATGTLLSNNYRTLSDSSAKTGAKSYGTPGFKFGNSNATTRAHNNIQPSIVANYIVKAKTSSHTITTSNVMTVHNESDENTYSTNYINSRLAGKLLWTNASPTSGFASQTITLNESLSNYDSYEIIFRQSINSSRYFSTGKIPVGYGTILEAYGNNYRPTGTTVSGNTISFESASPDNSYVMPVYVIGHNTGLFS